MSFFVLLAHFLLLRNNILLSGYITVYYSPTKGYLDWFQVLAVMSKAAIDIHMQVKHVCVDINFQLMSKFLGLFTGSRGKLPIFSFEGRCQVKFRTGCFHFVFLPTVSLLAPYACQHLVLCFAV